MSRLELAADRLAAALKNLEKAADSLVQNRSGAAENDPRNTAVESERQQLQTRIAALEDELASLSGITEEVENRLDGAIGEIRAALARS